MSRRFLATAILLVVVALLLAWPAMAKKGPPAAELVNNLSFPAIAADGFAISPIATENPTLTYPYLDPATGLPLILDGSTWYAQKVTGNAWQARFHNAGAAAVGVYGIDWGDNVESVYPTVRRPYRLEIVLFEEAAQWALAAPPENAFRMALLANASSPDEIQGTNGVRYDSAWATVVSAKPKLSIQNISNYLDTTLTWDGAKWVAASGAVPPQTVIGFGPELNVAGRYIFGASTGGWKPTTAGVYRVTFYLPGSAISLADAQLGDLGDDGVWTPAGATTAEDDGGGAATPVLDTLDNITYVDLTVQPRN